MQYFDASDNPIYSMDWMESVYNLQILILRNTEIKDFTQVRRSKGLLYLDISGTTVGDLSLKFLLGCPQIMFLGLDDIGFSKFPELPFCNLVELSLNGNRIGCVESYCYVKKISNPTIRLVSENYRLTPGFHAFGF